MSRHQEDRPTGRLSRNDTRGRTGGPDQRCRSRYAVCRRPARRPVVDQTTPASSEMASDITHLSTELAEGWRLSQGLRPRPLPRTDRGSYCDPNASQRARPIRTLLTSYQIGMVTGRLDLGGTAHAKGFLRKPCAARSVSTFRRAPWCSSSLGLSDPHCYGRIVDSSVSTPVRSASFKLAPRKLAPQRFAPRRSAAIMEAP